MDRLADLALVAVGGRGVDVPIPGVECSAHGVTGLVGGCLEDTEAEGGYLDAVVQGQERGSDGVMVGSVSFVVGMVGVFSQPGRSGARGSR